MTYSAAIMKEKQVTCTYLEENSAKSLWLSYWLFDFSLSGFDERMLSAGVGSRDIDQMSDSQISGTAITGPVVNKR